MGSIRNIKKLVEVPPEVYFGRTMLLTVYKKKEVAALGKYKVVFYGSFAEQSPQQLKILKDFISANKYCIVLTARDHKNNESIESIMDKFATVGLDKFVIGTTPTLNTYNDPISMTMKIDAWLEQNQGSVAQYVIMDDMSNMLHYNKTKLIKIENEITIMDTLKATAIMNKGSNY